MQPDGTPILGETMEDLIRDQLLAEIYTRKQRALRQSWEAGVVSDTTAWILQAYYFDRLDEILARRGLGPSPDEDKMTWVMGA